MNEPRTRKAITNASNIDKIIIGIMGREIDFHEENPHDETNNKIEGMDCTSVVHSSEIRPETIDSEMKSDIMVKVPIVDTNKKTELNIDERFGKLDLSKITGKINLRLTEKFDLADFMNCTDDNIFNKIYKIVRDSSKFKDIVINNPSSN